jgi:hypothetical protein
MTDEEKFRFLADIDASFDRISASLQLLSRILDFSKPLTDSDMELIRQQKQAKE